MATMRKTAGMAGLRYPGKVVIVTGGTEGIGLAVVKEFIRQGAKVVFCTKPSQADTGREVERELNCSGCPGEACFQVCDVRNEQDIKRLIEVTLQRYGCLDCLVNNAGDGYAETIDEMTAQDFRNIMEINVVGALLASKYALPYLRQTKGNIINMAGITGLIGMKNLISYSTSKGAMIAMTKTMAIDESKYGVRVNSVVPGHIWTALWNRYAHQSPDPEAVIEEGKSCQLMGRFGTPEEVASAVLYLAADATFCTGTDIVMTGGAEVGFGVKNQVPLQPLPCPSGIPCCKQ